MRCADTRVGTAPEIVQFTLPLRRCFSIPQTAAIAAGTLTPALRKRIGAPTRILRPRVPPTQRWASALRA